MIREARDARVAGIGLLAAEPLREQVTHLEMLRLLRRPEGQEELGVHAQRPRLQAQADQQRGALREPRIDAPRAAAPAPARGLARLLRIARGVEARAPEGRARVP